MKKSKIQTSRRDFVKAFGLTTTGAMLASPLVAGTTEADLSNLKIGVLLSRSNVYPEIGKNLIEGLKLHLDQEKKNNERFQYELVNEEIGYGSPMMAQDRSQKLILENKVDLVVGMINNEVVGWVKDIFLKYQKPLIVINAGENFLNRSLNNPYIFYNTLNLWQSNWAMGQWAKAHLGKKGLIAVAQYDSGYDALYAFQAGFEEAGGQIVQACINCAQNGEDHTSDTIKAIQELQPDFVFGFYHGPEAIRFIKAYKDAGLNKQIPLVTAGFAVDEDLLPEQGSAALGIKSYLTWGCNLPHPGNKHFVKAYRKATGQNPRPFSVLGFETAQLITGALEITGDKQELHQGICQVKFLGPRGELKMDQETKSSVTPHYLREVQLEGLSVVANQVIDQLKLAHLDETYYNTDDKLKSGWLNPYLCV